MAYTNKPIDWQNEGTEPSSTLKTNGFEPGMKPAADTFNYFWHNTGECISELQTKVGDPANLKTTSKTSLVEATNENKQNIDTKVPTSRTINGKALTEDITLTPNDMADIDTENIADGAITQAKINGLTATISELNYMDGVTSSVQTQLNNKSTTATYTTTLNTTWNGTAAPYTKTQTVTGILATDNPIVDIVLSSTTATALEQLEAYSCISKITTSTNSITVTCLEDKPTVAIPLQLKVVR